MSYVITLVASNENKKPVQNAHISQIEAILEREDMKRTCEPVWLAPAKAIDLGIPEKPNRMTLDLIRDVCDKNHMDFFVVPIENRRKKLLLADMDSTIVEGETLDDLADFVGLKDRISEITKRAMNGELDFHSAIRERVSLLKKLPTQALQEAAEQVKLNPGAKELVQVMKNHDAVCVLISGGFTYFTGRVARMAGFHHHHGNRLEIENELLTGKVEEPILDQYAKMEYLRHYVEHMKLSLENCLTIGDGANDVPMLKSAGLGIGYKPKEIVREQITNHIIHGDLTAALYAQGYTHQHIK